MPTTKYTRFKQNVKDFGVSRNNLFSIEFEIPVALRNLGFSNDIGERLSLRCETTEMPGVSLQTSEISYGHHLERMVNGIVYQQHPFTFALSRNYEERVLFDEWIKYQIDPDTLRISFFDDYKTSIIVNQLDRSGKIVYTVKMEDAFPYVITPIQLSNTSVNEAEKMQVDFYYKKLVTDNNLQTVKQSNVEPAIVATNNIKIVQNPIFKNGINILNNNDYVGEALLAAEGVNETLTKLISSETIKANQIRVVLEGIKEDVINNSGIDSADGLGINSTIDKVLGGLADDPNIF